MGRVRGEVSCDRIGESLKDPPVLKPRLRPGGERTGLSSILLQLRGSEAQRMVQRSYSPPLLRKHIIKTSSPSETSAKKDPRLESLFLPSLFFASVSSTFQVAYTLLNVLCVISLSCPGENLECCPIYVWCGGVDTWVPWKMKIKWCECPCECMHWGRMRR